jgi:hypothetical protein
MTLRPKEVILSGVFPARVAVPVFEENKVEKFPLD